MDHEFSLEQVRKILRVCSVIVLFLGNVSVFSSNWTSIPNMLMSPPGTQSDHSFVPGRGAPLCDVCELGHFVAVN